ncbi:hypothetical protein [Marivirga arenosa]|uniref:Uncharacterized protein n=1 Tax=Marivirga arenosa TaxID=3059076 RepID=A0AA51X3H2_9BACT|nr:hypothetical protein [Marivirga sp. BKB1-2]WNB17047.1 hypothetical protein QYS47_32720 [Marivirga sp. BKB1-2]
MRKLSSEQKEFLEAHIAKKPIEYIELYNELYDHYASAYENGELSLEETTEDLDKQFHDRRVRSINSQVLNKSQKAANILYKNEFGKFWKWPQVLTTVSLLIIIFLFEDTFPMKFILWGFMIPSLLFLVGLMFYPIFIRKTNKNKAKNFKSSFYKSFITFVNLPISLFNLSLAIPILFLEPYQDRLIFYEKYPIIPFTLLTVFLITIFIGLKVMRTKIKVQYI